ncbi:hypothetical protein CLF_103506 [Clonorchis sinensis]|uniref:Uncharacterized protein n=1 Tax=Clonorchis sinensis TaxID=79923 RepID=G7Y9V6_CLOSI|nr:hypothetical protein CLF_103506 [Clonorchis sinensis]
MCVFAMHVRSPHALKSPAITPVWSHHQSEPPDCCRNGDHHTKEEERLNSCFNLKVPIYAPRSRSKTENSWQTSQFGCRYVVQQQETDIPSFHAVKFMENTRHPVAFNCLFVLSDSNGFPGFGLKSTLQIFDSQVAVDLFAELGNWPANASSPYEETPSVKHRRFVRGRMRRYMKAADAEYDRVWLVHIGNRMQGLPWHTEHAAEYRLGSLQTDCCGASRNLHNALWGGLKFEYRVPVFLNPVEVINCLKSHSSTSNCASKTQPPRKSGIPKFYLHSIFGHENYRFEEIVDMDQVVKVPPFTTHRIVGKALRQPMTCFAPLECHKCLFFENSLVVREPQHFYSTHKRYLYEGDFNRQDSVHQKDNPGDRIFYWGNHHLKEDLNGNSVY